MMLRGYQPLPFPWAETSLGPTVYKRFRKCYKVKGTNFKGLSNRLTVKNNLERDQMVRQK